jgi:dTDP-4-dehydrorhamnose reductase
VSNQGPTTWYEFACAILEASGLDASRIKPITTAEYPTPAPRPLNSVLDNAAWRLMGFDPLPDWRPSLDRMLKELA